MTERKMSCKGFLHKTKTKAAASALAFLETHREFLLTGELGKLTSPILLQLDAKELLPTPALNEIKTAVFNHMVALENAKADAAFEKSQNPSSGGKTQNYIATIYGPGFDKEGNPVDVIQTRIKDDGEEEDLEKGFALPQECERWIDRRLTDGNAASDWYGAVAHTKSDWCERIEREDSFARILKQPKQAVLKAQKKTTSRLSFGVKAKQDTASFSRG